MNEDIQLYQPEELRVKDVLQMDTCSRLFIIRGVPVLLDRDLAELYSVDTKRINEQVRRNIDRFPERFRFQLSDAETRELVAKCDRLEKLKHSSASDLIRSARERIILIDNYIDDTVLLMLAKRGEGVTAEIITRGSSRNATTLQTLDLERHNRQYLPVTVTECDRYHDRFLIIDDTVYHLGASLKDLGKKLFAFSKMEVRAEEIVGSAFTE